MAVDGTWEKVFTALLGQADAEGELEWVVAVDSTIVRAHQHAAGARQKGPRGGGRGGPGGGADRAGAAAQTHHPPPAAGGAGGCG
ncbi:IS5/IS1182 family transposase, partial [Streptomyces lavendulae]